ncbi:MAG: DUF4339 domain-containing protein [Myxococcales bacterium]|nr:DUF4339 domain-containing protein [Myxococcales bacterium]
MNDTPMWYLGNDQQQHGPYSTEAVTAMLKGHQVNDAYIGAWGEEGWVRLDQHPLFAPVISSHRPGVAASPARRKGNDRSAVAMSLVLVAVFLMAILVVVESVSARWTSRLARFMPEDVSFYMEAGDLSGLFDGFAQIAHVDATGDDVEDFKKGVSEAIEETFDVDDEVAEGLIEDLRGVAFSGRGRPSSPGEEWALALEFTTDDDVEALLESKRFRDHGDLGDDGRLYGIKAGRPWAELGPSRSPLDSALSSFSLGHANREMSIVWFQGEKLLVLGTKELIEDIADVIDDDEPNLGASEPWGRVSVDDDAQVVVFVSSGLVDDVVDRRHQRELGIEELGPVVSSLRFHEMGTIATIEGSAGLRRDRSFEPVELDLTERLPRSTLAYVSYHPSIGITGRHIADLVVDALPQEMRILGVKDLEAPLIAAHDLMKGERLIAMAVSDELQLDDASLVTDVVPHVAIALVTRVDPRELDNWRKTEPLSLLLSSIPSGRKDTGHELSWEENDVRLTAPSSTMASARATILGDGVVVIAIGGEDMIDELVEAVRGNGPRLGDDAEHQAFVETIGMNERLRSWVDVRRMVQAMPDSSAPLSEADWVRETGLAAGVMEVDGDEPVMLGVAIAIELQDQRARVEIRALNVVAGPSLYHVVQFGSRMADALTRRSHAPGVDTRFGTRTNPFYF